MMFEYQKYYASESVRIVTTRRPLGNGHIFAYLYYILTAREVFECRCDRRLRTLMEASFPSFSSVCTGYKQRILVAGILTNCLLIYCIRRHTKLSLGAYKQLLTIFASFDLYLTTLHALIDPVLAHLTPVICDNFQKILIVNSTFGLNSNSPFLPVDRVSFIMWILQESGGGLSYRLLNSNPITPLI